MNRTTTPRPKSVLTFHVPAREFQILICLCCLVLLTGCESALTGRGIDLEKFSIWEVKLRDSRATVEEKLRKRFGVTCSAKKCTASGDGSVEVKFNDFDEVGRISYKGPKRYYPYETHCEAARKAIAEDLYEKYGKPTATYTVPEDIFVWGHHDDTSLFKDTKEGLYVLVYPRCKGYQTIELDMYLVSESILNRSPPVPADLQKPQF